MAKINDLHLENILLERKGQLWFIDVAGDCSFDIESKQLRRHIREYLTELSFAPDEVTKIMGHREVDNPAYAMETIQRILATIENGKEAIAKRWLP